MIKPALAVIAMAVAMLCAPAVRAAPPDAVPPEPADAVTPLSFTERHPDLKPYDGADVSPAEREQREPRWREHFERGIAAIEAGDFATCEMEFAQARVLIATPGTLASLGFCENRLGYYADAAEHLRLALAAYKGDGKPEGKPDSFRTRTDEELQRAMSRLGTLDLQNVPKGAVISIGPKVRLVEPIERLILLYPGRYTLEVRVGGELLHTARLHILAGQAYVTRLPTVVTPQVVPPVLPTPVVVPDRAAGAPSLPVVIAGSAGAAAFLGVAVGFYVASEGRLSDAAKVRTQLGEIFGGQTGACHTPTGPRVELCKKLDAATDDGAIFLYAGTTALVTSGVLGLGTTMYGLWPRSDGAAPTPPNGAGASITRASVAVHPGGAGAMIEGIF